MFAVKTKKMEKGFTEIPLIYGPGGGSVVSTLQDEVADESAKATSVSGTTEDQLFDKIEVHLLDKIQSGDKSAEFLLGQFYYEEVNHNDSRKKFKYLVFIYFSFYFFLPVM